MATDPTFRERLKHLRESAGLTQYALAKQSGVTAQAIAKLERGDSEPTWETVRKLARALGVTTDEFDAKGDEPPAESTKKPTPKKPKR